LTQPTGLTANITTHTLSITASTVSGTYGSVSLNDSTGFSAFGLQNNETIGAVVLTTNATLSSSGTDNVGSWTITAAAASGGTFTASNYAITYQTGSLTVSAKSISVSGGVSGTNKVYDGLTSVTLTFSSPTLSGVLAGDSVSINPGGYTANFASASVGNNKAITVTGLGLSGTDAADYSLTQPTGLTANITARTLTITASDVSGLYGSVSLNGSSGFSAVGLQNGEAIGSVTLATNATLSSSGKFNLGIWTITPSAATGGTFNPANYAISYVNGTLKVRTTITLNPLSQSVAAGTSVTFTAALARSAGSKVQWQVSSNGGQTWVNVAGATSPALTLTAATSANGWRYRALFTTPCGTLLTTAALLTVRQGPHIGK
jgi:hypothetical protein